MQIILTPDQEFTLKATHHLVRTSDGQSWYHQLYWLKEIGNGRYEQVQFEHLPESVKDQILTQRGIK